MFYTLRLESLVAVHRFYALVQETLVVTRSTHAQFVMSVVLSEQCLEGPTTFTPANTNGSSLSLTTICCAATSTHPRICSRKMEGSFTDFNAPRLFKKTLVDIF